MASLLIDADRGGLERWIRYVDEWARVRRAFVSSRVVEGSTGQPVLNPLAGYIRQLEDAIHRLEERYGLTPYARTRLGIAVGQAKLTAQALNRQLEEELAETVERDGSLLEGWEQA